MPIQGQWEQCADGVTRPVVRVHVVSPQGQRVDVRMLVDSAADRSVFVPDVMDTLQPAGQPPSAGLTFQDVGGVTPFVEVTATLEWPQASGPPAHIRGQFAAFTDPKASDMCILGRDVLNHIDVILSRRRNDVLLLAPNHAYVVTAP